MGLYQLAEFPIQNEEGNYPTGAPDVWCWWPHVGLMASLTFEGEAFQILHVVALDGVAHHNYGTAGDSFWPEKNLMVRLFLPTFPGNVGWEFTYEPRVGVRGATADQQDIWPAGLSNYIKMPGRRIFTGGSNRFYDHRNGSTETAPIGPVLPFFVIQTGVGRDNYEVMTRSHGADGNGAAIFYNVATDTLSKPYYVGEPYYYKNLYYVPEWQIFLTVVQNDDPSGAPWLIKLWSMEVRPTIVTEPEVVQGTLRAGQVVTFRVQVTGNKNDPAENELVEWALTGDIGLLLDEQSLTNADGYATARVKIDVGETGTLDIEASVKC